MTYPAFYLTNRADSTGALLTLLQPFHLLNDTVDTELVDAGWSYAEFNHTGVRVLVRSKQNRRWLAAWGAFVTDFEVHEVDTVATDDGIIVAALGRPEALKLYGLADRVSEAITTPEWNQ